MPASTCYAIASPNIVHEIFDDEVVIVNLDSGSYYSTSEVGAICWRNILEGCSVDQIIAAVASLYAEDRLDVRNAVLALVGEMETEGLIVRCDTPSKEGSLTPVPSDGTEKRLFRAPVLDRYDDMQQLLLIDPVHMVNEDGWPNARGENTSTP